jgi:acyl-coenzyme A thioesterase PaaI-like protein
MTLLDSAMGCCVHTCLPLDKGYTTLEVKVNLVRAITAQTGTIRATGRVIHFGGRTATAEARLEDAEGKLYAHGTTTCILIERPGDASPGPQPASAQSAAAAPGTIATPARSARGHT